MRTIAFTLIEVLVVVGILATLAALLFPVFTAAREKGAESADIQQIRQLGMAVHLYGAEVDDLQPPGMNAQSFAHYLREPDLLPISSGVRKPWATFGDLMAPVSGGDAACMRSGRSGRQRTPLGKHRECGFLYDEWAGLRQLKLGTVAPEVTLLYPNDQHRVNAKRERVPCLRHGLNVTMTVLNACEAETTWWHD